MRSRRRDPKLAWLQAVLPLGELPTRELRALAGAADRAVVADGTVLGRQGQVGREAFVIVSGEVEILRDGRRVACLGAGEVVGELAMLEEAFRTADIRAVGEVELLVFDTRSFTAALHASAALRDHVDSAVRERAA
jgi:CRP/FNR family transcriptional regulator, cyclic AMP receptor protein